MLLAELEDNQQTHSNEEGHLNQEQADLQYSYFDDKKSDKDIVESIKGPQQPAEPLPGPDTVVLNFRLPVTGDRVSRRFDKLDKVQALYDYIDILNSHGDCSFETESLASNMPKQQVSYIIV